MLCGHLMCEKDVLSFDPKMNDDNLSKCLQTLKEFYRDLRRKVSSLSHFESVRVFMCRAWSVVMRQNFVATMSCFTSMKETYYGTVVVTIWNKEMHGLIFVAKWTTTLLGYTSTH